MTPRATYKHKTIERGEFYGTLGFHQIEHHFLVNLPDEALLDIFVSMHDYNMKGNLIYFLSFVQGVPLP